jgi:hypothetical protein
MRKGSFILGEFTTSGKAIAYQGVLASKLTSLRIGATLRLKIIFMGPAEVVECRGELRLAVQTVVKPTAAC